MLFVVCCLLCVVCLSRRSLARLLACSLTRSLVRSLACSLVRLACSLDRLACSLAGFGDRLLAWSPGRLLVWSATIGGSMRGCAWVRGSIAWWLISSMSASIGGSMGGLRADKGQSLGRSSVRSRSRTVESSKHSINVSQSLGRFWSIAQRLNRWKCETFVKIKGATERLLHHGRSIAHYLDR